MTLNLGHDYGTPNDIDFRRIQRLINHYDLDIVAFQESGDDEIEQLFDDSWSIKRAGSLAVASRYRIAAVEDLHQTDTNNRNVRRNGLIAEIAHPNGSVKLANVHFNTPRKAITGVVTGRAAEQKYATDRIAETYPAVDFVVGDFNTPVESSIYRGNWREFSNAYSFAGFGFGKTKRTRYFGLYIYARIDHILVGTYWKSKRCWVGPNVGPDHYPLIAELCVNSSNN